MTDQTSTRPAVRNTAFATRRSLDAKSARRGNRQVPPGSADTVAVVGGRGTAFEAVRENARYRFASLSLRFTPLWAEMTGFARWVEDGASAESTEPILISLRDDWKILSPNPKERTPLGRLVRLRRFLRGVGVHEIELDPRLECNQVSDVLTLIYAVRRRIGGKLPRSRLHPAARLVSDEGVAIACTVTRIQNGRLTISYSYCMTRFSRLVKWFKERQTTLRDHRALFRAAPRYAAIVGLAPMAVFSLYTFHESWPLLLATSVFGAAVLGGATYLFFMTAGSLEYDNEQQAYTLKQAYAQVKRYADSIRSDMDRARAVQLRLLPDLQAMPLADQLEWSASFVPQEGVSGDYYDAALVGEDRVALVFADVSGHGLGAALVTAIIKTTFEEWLTRGSELTGFVRLLNQRLHRLTPDQSFAAVAVGIYDASNGEFSYCNCGHNPYPFFISHGDRPPLALDAAQTIILGVLPEIEPVPASLRLESGDTLLFATDGITEAENESGEEFTTQRLQRYLEVQRGADLEELVTGIVESVDEFTGGCDQGDDRTMFAVRVR